MPRFTEKKIEDLSAKALNAESEQDAKEVLPLLGDAIHEHVELAKENLQSQLSALETLETKSKR